MPFVYSFEEMEQAVDEANLADRRPVKNIIPVGDSGRIVVDAVVKAITGARWETGQKNPVVIFEFSVTAPEWVTPSGVPSSQDDETAVWLKGLPLRENAFITAKAMWKFGALIAGFKDRFDELGYEIVKLEGGKKGLSLPVDFDFDVPESYDPDTLGKQLAETLQPLVGESIALVIRHSKGGERVVDVDKETGEEVKEIPIYNNVAVTLPLK